MKRICEGPLLSIDSSAVQELIEERISPLIAVDGAEIELISVDDDENLVTIRFGGSYRGSPCRGIVLDFVVIPILNQALGESVQVKIAD